MGLRGVSQLLERLVEDGDCGRDGFGWHHEVGDSPERIGSGGQHAHSGLIEGVGEFGCIDAGDMDHEDIGFDRDGVDLHAGGGGESSGELLGVEVIFSEAVAVVFEGVEGGGGEDAALAHGAAEHFAEAAGAVDEVGGTAEGGTDRGAETFREADAYRVEVLGVGGFGDS
ncbi:MAG: hypothetical protein RI897_599 [Verrucomicrobiota bacterium]